MSSSEAATSIDSLIKELGDCGLFQVFMVVVVHGSAIASTWAGFFMAYGNYNPGWSCSNDTQLENVPLGSLPTYANTSRPSLHNGTGLNSQLPTLQFSCSLQQDCQEVVYSSSSSTIVTEWNLTCSRAWIASLILSLQGGGYIVGTLLAGFLNNKIGRKPTHFWGMGFHAVFNLVSAFSYSWPMFAVLRVLIGATSGSIAVTNFVYPMEFLTDKWRAISSFIPFSNVATLLFAVTAMALRDWRAIQVTVAILSAALVAPVVWTPESIRWLTVRGRTEEAVKVAHQVAKVNRKPPCDMEVILSVSKQEGKAKKDTESRSILDLYKHGYLKRTVVLNFTLMTVIISFTIITFGINSLSGDFYINMILLSLIPCITLPIMPTLTSSGGRKLSSILMLGLMSASAIGLIVLDLVANDSDRGLGTRVLSLFLVVVVDAEWAIVMLYVVELYPTSLRSVGYSYCVCVARLGALAAPFLIPHDEDSAFISHIAMAFLMVTSFFLAFLLPETKGKDLEDYIALENE